MVERIVEEFREKYGEKFIFRLHPNMKNLIDDFLRTAIAQVCDEMTVKVEETWRKTEYGFVCKHCGREANNCKCTWEVLRDAQLEKRKGVLGYDRQTTTTARRASCVW